MKLCLLGVSPVCIWLDSSHWLQSSLLYWSIYYWGLSLVLVSIHSQHCEDIFSFPNLFPVLLLLIHCTTSLVLRHFLCLTICCSIYLIHFILNLIFTIFHLPFELWGLRTRLFLYFHSYLLLSCLLCTRESRCIPLRAVVLVFMSFGRNSIMVGKFLKYCHSSPVRLMSKEVVGIFAQESNIELLFPLVFLKTFSSWNLMHLSPPL